MNKDDELPVSLDQACKDLGCCRSYMSALRNAMNLKSRYIFMSEVRQFLRANPDFTSARIYHRRGCNCERCRQKMSVKTVELKIDASDAVKADKFSQIREDAKSHEVKVPKRSGQAPAVGNELGHKLKLLRGQMSCGAVAKLSGLSTESVRRIELGRSPRIKSLKKIVTALNGSSDQWVGIVIAWIKCEAGDECECVKIEPRQAGQDEAFATLSKQTQEAVKLFDKLSVPDRDAMIFAMQQSEVLRCMTMVSAIAQGSRQN